MRCLIYLITVTSITTLVTEAVRVQVHNREDFAGPGGGWLGGSTAQRSGRRDLNQERLDRQEGRVADGLEYFNLGQGYDNRNERNIEVTDEPYRGNTGQGFGSLGRGYGRDNNGKQGERYGNRGYNKNNGGYGNEGRNNDKLYGGFLTEAYNNANLSGNYSRSYTNENTDSGYGNRDQGYGNVVQGYGKVSEGEGKGYDNLNLGYENDYGNGFSNQGYGNNGNANQGYEYNRIDPAYNFYGGRGYFQDGYRGPQGRGRFGLGWDHRTLFADSLKFPLTPESYEVVGRGFYRSLSAAYQQGA